jgi:DNA adenine methylase
VSKSEDIARTGRRTAEGTPVLPFLKWPGGKRWLVPTLLRELQGLQIRKYYEPFLGGGALFFALRPSTAVLSDINPQLVNTYRQVKNCPSALTSSLRTVPINKKTYDAMRAKNPSRVLDQAVRFLYLNRTAFAEMYRLNRSGEFNVPYGGGERTTILLWESNLISAASRALRSSELRVCDFEVTIAEAGMGDLVYCDPTYTVTHNNNGFIRYNQKNFSWDDQKRLAQSCHDAARRGALVLVSNAFHKAVLQLYSPPRHFVVTRQSLLCPTAAHRTSVKEYVLVFPPEGQGRSIRQLGRTTK